MGFRYNPEADAIDIFGWNMGANRKFRNIQIDPRVAFVVADVASVDRGIHPQRSFTWGLDGNRSSRRTGG